MVLRSYVNGSWTSPSAEGAPLLDAVTGEQVATISSARHRHGAPRWSTAAAVGGPALRGLTFHERAAILKSRGTVPARAPARAVRAVRPDRRDPAATPSSTSTAASACCSATPARAAASCPTTRVLLDGDVEPLGKGGQFLGQHILTPAAAAWPSRSTRSTSRSGDRWRSSRPRSWPACRAWSSRRAPTAYLTARLVELDRRVRAAARRLAAADLRQRRGPARPSHRPGLGLVHRLGRRPPSGCGPTRTVVARSVRFNAEADSLNCSILGPDAGPGTPGVRPVRRAARHRDDRQGRAEVHRDPPRPRPGRCSTPSPRRPRRGWPRSWSATRPTRAVRMGALASLDQRDEVRRSLKALLSAGTARVRRPRARRGGRRRRRPRRVHLPGAAPRRRRRPGRAARSGSVRAGEHAHRLPRHRDAIELAARGLGSLAGSVVTGDAGFARDVVLGVAPWHGRLLVLDRDDAPESTGHGSPLPVLVHGGPGRAGGGEELGGMRGVLHHMQRTAVQASPRVLAAVTGRWVPGATRSTDGTHPFRKSLAELRIGDSVVGRAADGDRGRHRALRRVHRRHLLRPHRRGGRGRATRSSTASSRTATWSCRWRPACSSTPTPGRCWLTTAWTTCASSPRSTQATS